MQIIRSIRFNTLCIKDKNNYIFWLHFYLFSILDSIRLIFVFSFEILLCGWNNQKENILRSLVEWNVNVIGIDIINCVDESIFVVWFSQSHRNLVSFEKFPKKHILKCIHFVDVFDGKFIVNICWLIDLSRFVNRHQKWIRVMTKGWN